MNTYHYRVVSIEGDYAYLKMVDDCDIEPKMVARALLPENIMEGTKLLYEFLEYSIEE